MTSSSPILDGDGPPPSTHEGNPSPSRIGDDDVIDYVFRPL